MPTESMSVFVRGENGEGGTYAVNLDTCKDPKEWEAEYLKQGFRQPETGEVIRAENITTVAVRRIEKSPLAPFPSGGALAWLEEQVDQTCALGLSP